MGDDVRVCRSQIARLCCCCCCTGLAEQTKQTIAKAVVFLQQQYLRRRLTRFFSHAVYFFLSFARVLMLAVAGSLLCPFLAGCAKSTWRGPSYKPATSREIRRRRSSRAAMGE